MPVTSHAAITPSKLARPKYLEPVTEPGFGSKLTRIAGDTGSLIVGLPGEDWDLDARHGYSRRNPGNCDGSLLYIEQRRGSPSKLLLDGRTYAPIKGDTGNLRTCTEVRWHPTKPTVMIGYNKSTREIVIFDVLSNVVIKRISVPFAWLSSNGGFMGEGSCSNDASVVCFGDEKNNVCLIDLVNGRVGPMQKVDFVRAPGHALGNISVSPLSTPARGYVVAKASDTPELVHVYTYGPDLILVHHFESDLTLSHGDVGLTPAGREVFCGGARTWFGPTSGAGSFSKKNGNIAAIHLDNGEVKNISPGETKLGGKEAADQHCSCRGNDGWVCVTYAGEQETSGRFVMTIVLYKLDGSGDCIQVGVTRTNESKTIGAVDSYRNEAHAVQLRSKPGEPIRVVFATNWYWATLAPGNVSDVKSYVYEVDGVVVIEPPPPVTRRFGVDLGWTVTGIVTDRKTGRNILPYEAADLLEKWVK